MKKIFNINNVGFTLLELLIVIGIISILTTVSVVVLNPVEFLEQSRDSKRMVDLKSIDRALIMLKIDQPGAFFGTSSIVYVSIPDISSTCANLGLPSLSSGWSYACAPTSTFRKVDGTGWIPVNFTNIFSGSPLSVLPVDQVNTTSAGQYYTYVTN